MRDRVIVSGADSCKQRLTRSRGMAEALLEVLKEEADAVDLEGATLKVSGCPNSCGHHWLATIGLQGAVIRAGDKRIPAYQILLGGSAGAAGTHIGRSIGRVPARRIPEAVRRLIGLYRSKRRAQEDFASFAGRVDVARARRMLADLQAPTPSDEKEALFVDFGETQEFRVETGEGECAR